MKTLWTVLWLIGLCNSLSGQVLMKEDFSKKLRFPDEVRSYHYRGAYHVYSYENVSFFEKSKNYQDFAAEIRTEFISGDTTAYYGLLFRHDAHVNGYSFIVSTVGHYFLQRSYLKPGGGVGEVEVNSLVYGTADSVFNKRGVNYLKAECSGNIIRLFINGQKIDSVADSTLHEGVIGFRVGKAVHVHLDDLTVYRKYISGKYSFKPAIPDSAFDEKNDSLTVNLVNFDTPTHWRDDPGAFHEKGLYRIDSTAYSNSYLYNANINNENFSYLANFKILHWPRKKEMCISWYNISNSDETEIVIQGDSVMQYHNKHTGSKSTVQNFPFNYETGTLVRLRIDKKDGDTKISVNNQERILIIDESYEPKNSPWIEIRTRGISIDLFSVKVSRPDNDDYGLGTKDISCPVIRVSGNSDSGKKPALGDDSDKIPEDDASLKKLFLTIIIIGVTQILLIWGIVKWRNATRYNSTHFLDYIRERNGSFSLNEFLARFRMSRSKAIDVMDTMVKDYAGYRYPVDDKNDAFYDFPTFMSDVPKPLTVSQYPDFIERMITAYAKRINLPEATARFYFIQICTLAAHLQGRLSVHTLNKKIEEGNIVLDRAHFSPYKNTWDIVIVLMSQIIDDERYIRLLSDDTPAVLKFHEDLCKHFR